MQLTFRLRFHTHFGQSLSLVVDHKGLGWEGRVLPLEYLNWEFWQTSVEIDSRSSEPFRYHYFLRNTDGTLVHEAEKTRAFVPSAIEAQDVLLIDVWNDTALYENAFYTEAFQEVLLKSDATEVPARKPRLVTHTFNVKAPLLARGQTICLVGGAPALGAWDTARALCLARKGQGPFFTVQADLSHSNSLIEYKYGIWDVFKNSFVSYEDGPNRVLYDEVLPGKHTILHDGFAMLPADTWNGVGVAVPVFSLRSNNSFGVGEFADLKPLADWCSRTGLKLIQILPVNDTTATHTMADSYPYAAISAFALHPIYLNLNRVIGVDRSQPLPPKWEAERRRLNELPTLDYQAVSQAKLSFLKEYYADQKQRTFSSPEYKRFFEQNRDWLEPYAAFCHFRDTYGTPDFNQWPEHRRFQPVEISSLATADATMAYNLGFYYFLQYQLHIQLREARDYAHALGVVLKGDIPIGVYRYGADVWEDPEQFRLDMQAGAPPDAFGVKGQNWSFPTYNWPRMKSDGYQWWKRRLRQMGEYFDAFRIDHILGFFRIWSVPLDAVEGILGHFVPALPVQREEFVQRGVAVDHSRFTRPYITDEVLETLFGLQKEEVKSRFLIATDAGNYRLRPELETQRQVEAYFASSKAGKNSRFREGLFDLVSNVILLEEPGSEGQLYHFRFGVENTSSFRNLDPLTRQKLLTLYEDYFFRRQETFWAREGLEKLPALKRVTDMLVCGEDLGMVPACVPRVMKQLGLLSLEIQRMPKRLGRDFFRPREAPYLSVVSTGTHDMNPLRAWWKEHAAVTQRFFNEELGQEGNAPEECEPWVVKAILQQHLASPAMWSIFPIQDLLAMDAKLRRQNPAEERINVPADPNNQWQYRVHTSLEDLLQADAFNQHLQQLIREHGR